MSFIILPINFLAQLLFILELSLADYCLDLLNSLLSLLVSILTYLADMQINTIHYQASLAAVLIYQIGLYLVIQKKGFPGRYLAAALIAAILLLREGDVDDHELILTVLDVGQGLSVVIETAQHVMVYDTGLSTPSGFSMSNSVIKPYLLYRNIK